MTTADEDRIALRQAEAIKLRIKGKSFREIGRLLGVSMAQAHADVRAITSDVAKQAAEDAEVERAVAVAKLDGALEVLNEVLEAIVVDEKGNCDHELKLKTIDRLVKLEERRAKLLGLDAPARSEVAGSLSVGSADPVVAARLVREAFGAQAVPKVVSESGSQEEAGGIPVGASGE